MIPYHLIIGTIHVIVAAMKNNFEKPIFLLFEYFRGTVRKL